MNIKNYNRKEKIKEKNEIQLEFNRNLTSTGDDMREIALRNADRKTLKANFSIKYTAYHAGLGNFGMNHLLITKDFGPRVIMTAILTDAPLEKEEKDTLLPFINEKCSTYMKCIEICPAGAIFRDGKIDREKCAQYMFNVLGGLRCGLCVKVCPE